MQEKIKSIRDLKVYDRAYKLAMEIFNITKKFPKEESYSLTDQVRRSSRSVAINVREGYAKRKYEQVFIRHLNDSLGSGEETRGWLDFARDCKYISEYEHRILDERYDEVNAMLYSLMNSWQNFSKSLSSVICLLSSVICLLSPVSAFAGASISLSGGPWSLGAKGASSESTSSIGAWAVTNDNSAGTEDVLIKVSSTGLWTASTDTTPEVNEFLLRKYDGSPGLIITNTDQTLISGLANNESNSFGFYFKAPPVGSEEGSHTLTITLTAANWESWKCGDDVVVTHNTGSVAPVDKTVTYGTAAVALGAAVSKCWITQNLGATDQASSFDDGDEPSAGWYWQFNREAGWKYDSSLYRATTPTTWDGSNDNTYTGWDPAKDPCTLLLGAGWRLPTYTEWSNAEGGWNNASDAYNSVLKLHAAGYLLNTNGALVLRGSAGTGVHWSSTQSDATSGWEQAFNIGVSNMYTALKANGMSVRCVKDFPYEEIGCGGSIVVNHIAGDVAPVTKTVTYGTVLTNLTGAGRCWITQNLGATNQASAVTDSTEASAGWYWQFNRKPGWKYDGSLYRATTPTTWDESNDNTYPGWDPAKDPCTLLLGTGWRLPTYTEWYNADLTGGWASYTHTYASDLKLHAAGYLDPSYGALTYRGLWGYCRGSTQYSVASGWYLAFGSYYSAMLYDSKAYGFSVRCVKDFLYEEIGCGGSIIVNHTAGDVAPVTKTVTYGTVLTNLTGAVQCWITQNLGASNQASLVTDSTEPSAGWYWQFNRKAGWKYDSSLYRATTPTTWVTGYEGANWEPAKDPCTLLLGTGWRLPTYIEWYNADLTGGWTSCTNTYASVLKLHTAGYLDYPNGALINRGSTGYDWSSTQSGAASGWSLYFRSDLSYINSDNKAYAFSVRCVKDFLYEEPGCGGSIVVNHIPGDVAPVDKTVVYGIVSSTLGGTGTKCWITQNLGATNQASLVTDSTEASAGWYWQFNRKAGWKYDGSLYRATTPTTWDVSNDNTYPGWDPAKDPCTLLLGTGWRLPTYIEWYNADATGGWTTWTGPWNSVLKLHAAGYLHNTDGALRIRGSNGTYWSSTQTDATTGWELGFNSGIGSIMLPAIKAYGVSVRCLRDYSYEEIGCGGVLSVTHTVGDVAPVTKTVSYSTVLSDLSGASKCWIIQNLGAGNTASSATDLAEPSAGWYWQFNRKRGYKHDGTTRTPSETWNATIREESDWVPSQDPCVLLLGSDWRLPTSIEWSNADINGGWGNYYNTYASILKLHSACYLLDTDGSRPVNGYSNYWSSTQAYNLRGYNLGIYSTYSTMDANNKSYGFVVRCLRDE